MTFKEVTLYVSDDQLKELGNAIAAYADVLWAINLGLAIPPKFECLKDISKADLKRRIEILKNLHYDLSNK